MKDSIYLVHNLYDAVILIYDCAHSKSQTAVLYKNILSTLLSQPETLLRILHRFFFNHHSGSHEAQKASAPNTFFQTMRSVKTGHSN